MTLTAGLALGMTRDAAARYSFLMAVPITALACAHGAWSFARADEAFDARAMVLGIVVSALAGIAVIHFLLAILRRLGTAPFVVYRLVLGVVVLAMVALGAP